MASSDSLEFYLSDSQALRSLINPFSPFPPPTPQSKASFETKTSAIIVSPSPQARYDITQIKDDSLWLSKETSIDEVAALRIAVLEWQSRPADRLLRCDLSDALLKSAGGTSSQISFRVSQTSALTLPSFVDKDTNVSSDTPSARRRRLLLLYLSERRYIVKTCEHVIFTALCESTSHVSKEKPLGVPGWIGKIGHDILSAWDIHGKVRHTDKNFFVATVEAITTRIKALESGSRWSYDERFQEELELAFVRNQTLEIIHAMQLMFILLATSNKLPRSDAALSWFRLMATFGFLEGFQLVSLPFVITDMRLD